MRSAIAAAIGTTLAACAVGPDYKGPPDIAPKSIAAPTFFRADTAATDTGPPPDRWWEAMDDPVLNGLVDDAFKANPTLKSMVAQLRSARAQVLVSEGAFFPTGGTTTSYSRIRIPTESLTGSLALPASIDIPSRLKSNSYSGLLDATWELDIFGAVRRGIESSEANVQSVEASFYDAQVTLANNVVTAYAQLREAQNRVAIVRQTAAVNARLLQLTKLRRGGGTVTDADVAQQEGQGARDRAQQLQYTIDQQLDQIAILCGRETGAYDALLAVAGASEIGQPLPPGRVPIGTPSDWLRRRPDIRKAERTIQSRNALIGQNEADYFPSVSIIGYAARSGKAPKDLFNGQAITALMIPSIQWNFWQIPAVRGRVKGAEADRDQALADYENTVLTALQDANDSLSRFASSQTTAVERALAVDADERASAVARLRFGRGSGTELDVLNAERTLAQDRDQSVQARSMLMQNYASLQKSLGLGWVAAAPDPTSKAAQPTAAR